MATGQTLLNLCEVLDNELQCQPGEEDVTRALSALNASQDYLESILSQHPNLFGGSTGTVATAASTETSTFPTGLLRIDRLQFIDPTTSLPAWDLRPIRRVGGHLRTIFWPLNLLAMGSGGKPVAYYTNGTSIFWSPLPDGTHTVRYYGLVAEDDITVGGTIAYPDTLLLPLASFAVKLLGMGVGDETGELAQLAAATFGPAIDSLSRFNRDGAPSFEYSQIHET